MAEGGGTCGPLDRRRIIHTLRRQQGLLFVAPLVIAAYGGAFGGGFDTRWLIAALWGLCLIMQLAASGGTNAARGAAWLRRLDAPLAALAIHVALFVPDVSAAALAIFVSLALMVAALRRLPGPALASLLTAFLVFGVALPRALRSVIVSSVARTYDLDVDHRLKPDGDEINVHGVRFRGTPEALGEDEFVVLFLGDSFTFGFNLPYEASYPYRFEARAEALSCERRVRAVNMGWTSASPLLALRLLREVGYAYSPDLVLYSLDMTDFHDDLRYERALRGRGEFSIDHSGVISRLVMAHVPELGFALPALHAVTDRLRSNQAHRSEMEQLDLDVPIPKDRFFVTAQPLERSLAAMEAGSLAHLERMEAFSREGLGTSMALVLYPRAYQYSEREAPRSWESHLHERLGPWVREPFRYFEERRDALPYPVIGLLPHFEQSERFPLYFGNDPHWNAQGADTAAAGLLEELVEASLLPCTR